MNATIEAAVNDQVNLELFSAYLYLSMSAHFESTGLPGFAHWMRRRAKEEMGHAKRFFDFLNDRGARVALRAIDAPPADFASPLAAFEQALKHEQRVTASIHALQERRQGGRPRRPATPALLHLRADRGGEDGSPDRRPAADGRMVGGGTAGILVLDHHLAKRES